MYVAQGQFTGMITRFKNQSILLAMQALVDILTEIVGNDEFKSRAGTDDSTRDHFINLITDADEVRRLVTYNTDGDDIKSIAKLVDPNVTLSDSISPLSTDGVQLTSVPDQQIPWMFDGSDPNLPLSSELHFRNGVGAALYTHLCTTAVAWTRLESRNRSYMITKNDSLRMYSYYQTFYDLCRTRLGESNQKDLAQVLATDEPANVVPANRLTETVIVPSTSNQNAQRATGTASSS